MQLIAHRGLTTEYIKENTLEAFLNALNNGYDGVELDVRLTRDNEVVVIHDEDINRVSNGKGKVRDMTLTRLKRFNCGTLLKRERISTLDEVLNKLSPSSIIIIELKDEQNKNNILANKVLKIIEKYPNLDIWLKSFSKEIVNKLQEYSQNPVGILINKDNRELLDMDVDFYSISQKVINNEIVDNLLKQNKNIMVWTVNDENEIMSLKNNLGYNFERVYIISDRPLTINKGLGG